MPAPTISLEQRTRLGSLLLLCALIGPLCFAVVVMLWRVPYGTETLAILEDLENKSIADLIGFRGAYFRPGFWLALWLVWDGVPNVSQALTTYALAHAASVLALIVLVVTALSVRTRFEALCAAFAVTVLVASPAFRDNLENLPLNQMLLVMVVAAITWILSERPVAHTWHVPAFALLAVIGLSLKEQGLVVIALTITAYLAGAPGVDRRSAVAVAIIGIGYLGLRLTTGEPWPTFAQSVGVGFVDLSPDEAVATYGQVPLMIYAYNVAATAGNILFSEPTRGVFSIVRSFRDQSVEPWQVIAFLSSATLTACIVAWGVQEIKKTAADGRQRRAALLCAVAIAASAVLGFNYTRDRFGGVAMVFYAGAAYYAVRWLATVAAMSRRRMAMTAALLLLLATTWNVRAIGTVQSLRESAWAVRREWLADSAQRRLDYADRPTYVALINALYDQGTNVRADAPHEPKQFTRLLGDW